MRDIRLRNTAAVLRCLPILGIAMWIVSACSNAGCLENQNALPKAGFKDAATGKTISIDSIEVGGIGAPNDTLINAGRAISSVYLPFRVANDTALFYFKYLESGLQKYNIADTITFHYTSTPQLVSADCGLMAFYEILDVYYTRNIIDSVAVTDPHVTNYDATRIEIYFKTAAEDESDDTTDES